MAIKRIGVLTSGGDAPGMNAAVRAVVRTAIPCSPTSAAPWWRPCSPTEPNTSGIVVCRRKESERPGFGAFPFCPDLGTIQSDGEEKQ